MTFLTDLDDDVDPRELVVLGVIYTPDHANSGKGFRTNVYRPEDINADLVDQCVGLPVYIEHDDEFTVGEVLMAFRDENHNLNAFLHIAGNKLVNQRLPGALDIDPETNQRFYTGLSMGTDVYLDETSEDYTFVKEVIPKEVSIVRTPDRPGAEIIDYWVLPRHVDATEYVSELAAHIPRFER